MIANMKYKTMFGNCLGEVLKHGSPAACVMFVVGSSPQASAVSVPFNPIQALRTFTQYSLHQKKSWFSLLGGSVLVKKQPAEGEHNAQADNIKYSIHVSFIFESFSWDCSDCKKHTYWMSPKFTNIQTWKKKTKEFLISGKAEKKTKFLIIIGVPYYYANSTVVYKTK